MYPLTAGANAAGHQGRLVYTDSGKKLLIIKQLRSYSKTVVRLKLIS